MFGSLSPAALGVDFTVPDPFQAIFTPSMFTGAATIIVTVSGCQALQDNSVEGPHYFELWLWTLLNPELFSGVVTVDPTQLIVTIVDDDGECVDH